MPNWCENRLIVSGTHGQVKNFVRNNQNEEQPLTLAALVPQPSDIHERPAPEGMAAIFDKNLPDDSLDWYGWSLRHWGTKWDVNFDGGVFSHNPGRADYSFLTAWSPPEPWLGKVAALFPDLTFELVYYEPGNCFAGHLVYENGHLVSNEELDPSDDSISQQIWS